MFDDDADSKATASAAMQSDSPTRAARSTLPHVSQDTDIAHTGTAAPATVTAGAGGSRPDSARTPAVATPTAAGEISSDVTLSDATLSDAALSDDMTSADMSPDATSADAGSSEVMTLDHFLAGIGPRAFRFAELGLRHRDDALDAVQEAMIKMLQYRERPAEEWTPLFWSILRSKIVDTQRRGLFRLRWLGGGGSQHDDDDDAPVDWRDDTTPDPARAHAGREAYGAIAEALRELPRRQREAFTLRILEECDVATTARIMGCGEGAVKTHLSRAREALQRRLEAFR